MRSTFEPGILRLLQIVALSDLFLVPPVRRFVGDRFGIDVVPAQYLWVVLPGPLLLVLFTFSLWAQRRLGQQFVPIALLLFSANTFIDKYLTLAWLIPPQMRDLDSVLLALNSLIFLHVMVSLVALQYGMVWALAMGLSLSALDILLSVRFISRDSDLFPIFVIILVVRTFSVAAIGAGMGWLMDRQREQRRALAEANRQLIYHATRSEQLAISQERNRLARELHDTLAHSLSAVAVQLEAVLALWEVNTDAARSMLEQAVTMTRSGLTEARRALQALRASPLDDLGLALALTDLAKNTASRAGLKLDLDVPSHLDKAPAEVEQCVYRVAQEALANVARHAQARAVQVKLEQAPGGLRLTIKDDGRGFDVGQVNGKHYGLRGLAERAQMMGGTLKVDSAPGQGATVRLTVAMPGGTR